MAAKRAKGLSFADLEAALGRDEVWIASLFYGQSTASAEDAQQLTALLGLDASIAEALQAYPTKGCLGPAGDRVKVTMCGKFLAYKKW